MQRIISSRLLMAEFEGRKSLKIGDSCQDLEFVFENNNANGHNDVMRIQIYDESGFLPGESRQYVLTKQGKRGLQHQWPLLLTNPADSGSRKHDFLFVISLNENNPALRWPKHDIAVAGTYIFGETDRTMSVVISFDVRSDVTGRVEGACGSPR
ncbi:MAG: hypothetical protein NZM33_16645 [Bryobacteraceae bacterium]|nr:hypothetical protein [Bryobacteraceae bacterium]